MTQRRYGDGGFYRLLLITLLALVPGTGWGVTAVPLPRALPTDAAALRAPQRVALDGDTALIAVDGAVEVLVKTGAAWRRQARLTAPDVPGNRRFGAAVALDGDTAVIAAPDPRGRPEASGWPGSVFVFQRQRTTHGVSWSQQARIVLEEQRFELEFGSSVALHGDTLLIGAGPTYEDHFPIPPGRVHVYARRAGVWRWQTSFGTDDAAFRNAFGSAIALHGDTAVVSADFFHGLGADGDAIYGGASAAYVYQRSGEIWQQRQTLIATGAARVGPTQAVDIDAHTLVVGNARQDAAYLFGRAGRTWQRQAKLTGTGGFGGAVALDDQVALIGAAVYGAGTDSGSVAAYAFSRASGKWLATAKLAPHDDRTWRVEERFGHALALHGETALVLARGADATRRSGSAHLFRVAPPPPRLHCPDDADGDGVADVARVAADGAVTLKGLDGRLVNRVAAAGRGELVDSELMPDSNRNGSPEIVVLRARSDAGVYDSLSGIAEVYDLVTGALLSVVPHDRKREPVDLAVASDQTGNGKPELATLKQEVVDPAKPFVRYSGVSVLDSFSAGWVGHVGDIVFARWEIPEALEIVRDGRGRDLLAVLGDHRPPGGPDKVELRDLLSGVWVRDIWLGRGWRPRQQVRVPDLNRNGSDELAILRVHPDGRISVQIRDSRTGALLNNVGFPVAYPPTRLLVIPDIDGNGAHELVLVGRRFDGRNQKAVIKDSLTGRTLRQLWFDRDFLVQDAVSCGDLNRNGGHDIALLGQRDRDGRSKVIVKDSRTGRRLAQVWF